VGDAQRILVYGVTGSGKSSLARRLGQITGIPTTSVDDLSWTPGWVQVPRDEQRARFDELTKNETWILDAAYGAWRDLALERADVVVALDYPRWVSLARLLRRTLVGIVTRRELCNGNRESWRSIWGRESIVAWHFGSFARERARMRGWVVASCGPPVIQLRRPAHARSFVEAETARRRAG
jgi:adenylate kinase family enzyme